MVDRPDRWHLWWLLGLPKFHELFAPHFETVKWWRPAVLANEVSNWSNLKMVSYLNRFFLNYFIQSNQFELQKIFNSDNLVKSDMEIPWPADKIDIQDAFSSADNNESAQKVLASQYDERYCIHRIIPLENKIPLDYAKTIFLLLQLPNWMDCARNDGKCGIFTFHLGTLRGHKPRWSSVIERVIQRCCNQWINLNRMVVFVSYFYLNVSLVL